MVVNISDRKYVGRLLWLVRIGNINVRQALLNYPKDTDDESLVAAYHALIHYEADEDIRLKDNMYAQEQDDYIEFLSYTLDKGDDLPQNIIETYKQYYESAPILHQNNWKGLLKSFWKVLNIDVKNRK